jgi:hypothetical protein
MNAYVAGRRLAVMLATGGLVLTIPAAAFAGTPGSSSAHASTPGHFSYTDPNFGDVQCNEVHHPGPVPSGLLKQDPALPQTASGYDIVQCHLASPDTFTAGQTFLSEWFSDFDGQFGTIRIVENANGTGFHGVASYPAE